MVKKEQREIKKYMVTLIVLLSIIILLELIQLNNKPIILIEKRNQSCELVDNGWAKEYKPIKNITDNCYYPIDCFSNYSEYLKQFPEEEIPSPYCSYMVKCGKLNSEGSLNSSQP